MATKLQDIDRKRLSNYLKRDRHWLYRKSTKIWKPRTDRSNIRWAQVRTGVFNNWSFKGRDLLFYYTDFRLKRQTH